MSTATQIILNGMKDWDDWIEVIRTAALGADIWDLINPNKSKTQVNSLAQPLRPEPADIKPPAEGEVTTAYS
jgi:hypothetical protein